MGCEVGERKSEIGGSYHCLRRAVGPRPGGKMYKQRDLSLPFRLGRTTQSLGRRNGRKDVISGGSVSRHSELYPVYAA